MEILNTIKNIIQFIGSFGGLIYLWSTWKNRSRIIIHSASFKLNSQNKPFLTVELENLGNQNQSLKNQVEIIGIDPVSRKKQKIQAQINGERSLPPTKSVSLTIDIPNEGNFIFFWWYTEITIHTTKIGDIKIKFINSKENSISSINFIFGKFFLILFPKIHNKLFIKSKNSVKK